MNHMEKCMLCPRNCGVSRYKGETGFCNCDDKLKIARADLHYWEEPCISGKNGSGTVFFSHCNMKCVFCQNYNISTRNQGKIISISGLSRIFLELEEKGAHNINLVTPTHYIPMIIQALDMAKTSGLSIPVVYNTSGYEKVESLKLLEGYVDIYLPDFKYFDNKYALKYSSAPDYFQVASAALSEMTRQVGLPKFTKDGLMKKGVIVRHLMLPGLLFDSKKIIDYLYSTYKDSIYISIMSQYTPLDTVPDKFPELKRTLPKGHYDSLVDYAVDLGIKNAFIQDGASAKESFIPEFYTE